MLCILYSRYQMLRETVLYLKIQLNLKRENQIFELDVVLVAGNY